jgi:phosphoserine aminotransferase
VTNPKPGAAGALARREKPQIRPARPYFSSGPCAKPPGWAPEKLALGSLGRSHRSKLGKARLAHAIALTRHVLRVPPGHRIAIVPASDTGAVEMALWNLLGPRPVTLLAWESFGEGWVTDVVKQLKLDATVTRADYGALPDPAAVDPGSDVVFTWNGTTSGVRVPDGDWISDARQGLTICDATSAAFAVDLPWDKLDVTTFSWQKVLGGEGGHGMLILSPRAAERLESGAAPWPLPKIFRLKKDGRLVESVFRGETINTPSMLAVEDYIWALEWAELQGGLDALIARANANAAALSDWAARTDWIEHLAADPATRSNTSVCLKFADASLAEEDARALAGKIDTLLEREGAAYDINAYRDAPPGLRIWCGATVDTEDIEALGPWLDWAYAEARET